MAEQIKYISLDNLRQYDELIKNYIDTADDDIDAQSLKIVTITSDNKLQFFKERPPLSDPKPTPAYEIELPVYDDTELQSDVAQLKTDVSTAKVNADQAKEDAANAKAVADKLDGDDTVSGSVKAQLKALKEELNGLIVNAQKAGDDAQDAVDALETKMGTDIATALSTAKAYTDTEISKLGSVLNFKGIVATVSALPANTESNTNTVGDVYHVTADGSERVWINNAWEELGTVINTDGFASKSDVEQLQSDMTQAQSDISANTQAIAGEKARALAVEQDLQDQITAIEAVTGKIETATTADIQGMFTTDTTT